MTINKVAAVCLLRDTINNTSNDEAAALGEEEIITILKANIRGCPFLAMAKGIRVFEHQGELVVEVRL